MPRRVSLILSLAIISAVVLTTGISANAAPDEDTNIKQAEISEAQDNLNQIRAAAGASYAEYNDALARLNELDGKIEDTTAELDKAEGELAEAQSNLEERASQVYRSGNVGFLDVLVGVENFSDFSTRLDLWMRLLAREQAEFERVQEVKERVEARRENLHEQRAQREAAVEEAAAKKEQAAASESEAQSYLNSLNAELVEELRAQRRAELEEELAAQAALEEAQLRAAEKAAAEEAARQAELEAQRAAAAEAAAKREEAAEAQRRAEEAAARQYEAEQAAARQYEEEQAAAAARQYEEEQAATPATSAQQYEEPSGAVPVANETAAPVSSGGSCGDTFGGVQPHVAEAGCAIRAQFGIQTIYGVRAGDPGDHGSGLALDVMVYDDVALGDQVASYVESNWGSFGVSYIIYRQRINLGYGWEPMEDRGSPTANHMDHVHISFVAR